jgi:hypothetical protein
MLNAIARYGRFSVDSEADGHRRLRDDSSWFGDSTGTFKVLEIIIIFWKWMGLRTREFSLVLLQEGGIDRKIWWGKGRCGTGRSK